MLPQGNIPRWMLLFVIPRHFLQASEIDFMQGLGLPLQVALFASVAGSYRGKARNACLDGKACPACNPDQIRCQADHLVAYVSVGE